VIHDIARKVLVLAVLGLGGSAFAQDPVGDSYQVDIRDVLELQVYGETELSGTLTVAEQGLIDVPLLGPVDVDGLTAIEIARRVETELGERFLVNPHVTVRVIEYGSKEIQVLGAVKQPGLYYLTGPTTLLSLLSKAGGISKENIREVQVTRSDSTTIVVKLEELIGGNGNGDVLLQKGDSIYVPEGLAVYVGGEVARPGEVAFKEGMTITEAITLAGSWKPTALKTTVYILRDGQRMRVNVRRILRAKDADIGLVPGDQVQVPESAL
jgi:polysaccharide biosynthesis/export protein